ncbi:hypothetical protein CR513_10850, partial [Mucuna pruriens]
MNIEYMLQCYEFLCNNESKKCLLFKIPFHMNCKWLGHQRTNKLEMANKKSNDDFCSKGYGGSKDNDFQFFDSGGFEFQNILKVQRLDNFVLLDNAYFPNLVKVFYSNLSISNDGELCFEVNNIKIRVRPRDWLIIPNLKYHSFKFDMLKISQC